MDVLCCCCWPGDGERARPDEWNERKDIEYVLHHSMDVANLNAQPVQMAEPLKSTNSTFQAKCDGSAPGSSNSQQAPGSVPDSGEDDSQLLKEARSSSLKTELYRQIWQRRVLWFGQTLPTFEGRRAIEFWSGWNARRTSTSTATATPSTRTASHPPVNSCRPSQTDGATVVSTTAARRKNVTPEVSIESLQPELYAQTSVESTEGSSIDAGIGGCGDVGDSDGPVESTPLGQIHFSLVYDDHKKVLTVRIVEACHLPPPRCADVNSQKEPPLHSNAYVRVYLLPDQRDSRQTPVQRRTQSPVFNHGFTYELAHREVIKRTLMLKVLDLDRSSRQHHVIGQVQLALSELNLIKGVHLWKRIRPAPDHEDCPELGELLISLTYLPSAKRLNLDLLRGKQLLQTQLGGSVPYVRVSLVVAGKHVKTKKSSRKRNMDPVWGETLSFNVASGELPESSLVVSVWDYSGGIIKDYLIGRIVLSAKEPSGEEEMSHWSSILRDERTSAAQWHVLRTQEECDKISPASASLVS